MSEEAPKKRALLTAGEGTARTLDGMRKEMRDVDRRIIELVAERIRLAQTIGDEKRKRELPIQDFSVEKQVVDAARASCRELGIDEDVGEEVMLPLIKNAVRAQERDRVGRNRLAGGGKKVLVVGGAGLMGRWFAAFLTSQGHMVTVCDPAGPVTGFAHVTEVEDAAQTADVVIIATPPSVTSPILDDLGTSGTDAVVFDICSLKTPIKGALEALRARGVDVASIHPMFGPGVDLLSGRHIILCPLGSRRADDMVRSFFRDTCATIVEMSLDDHDQLVSYVLGLSHAVNILFNDVLARSGRRLDAIRSVASTTFDRQLAVARQLAMENPDLYYEIQALNAYTPQVLDSLDASMAMFARTVVQRDRKGFVKLMERAADYYAGRDPLGKKEGSS
ncbi:MAG: prephenate dehydrogenase/arogenate dehydrogenase family protein [Euryarchaeota archaeon]|nr:prephenate dehydrogenase/arogenate dehydrogenase family protein [Euryarchaeota archaeon]